LAGGPIGGSAMSGARRVATAPGAGRRPAQSAPEARTDAEAGGRTLDPARLADHVDRLYRAAWALSGSREEAEDLVQETFARVLAKPRVVHSEDDLGYLLRVLRNTFLTGRRTAGRRPQTVAVPAEVEFPDRRGGLSAEAALEARETFAAIAVLPRKFREALVAVDVVGLSYREAARVLGTREATITSRLFRARRAVVRILDGSTADGVL
jgi:RNA polymerase sigma-70 factor (ECF subfamily)